MSRYLSDSAERFFMWLAVGVVSLIAFETIAVGTAMPTVARALDGESLYALAMGIALAAQLVSMAFSGLWCDARRPQHSLYAGIGLFATGLLVCAFAPTMPVFVLGRAVMGTGGGLAAVPIYALIGRTIDPDHQPRFFAALAAAWVLPSLVGPGIAGFLVERTTWRLVFGIVPVLLLSALPPVVSHTRALPADPIRRPIVGLGRTMVPAFGAGASIALLQILSGTEPSEFSAPVYASIALAVLATFAFIRPILPRGTFSGRRGLPTTILVRGISSGAFLGVDAFLPLMLQNVHGWSPTSAGLILTVGSVSWAGGSWFQGRVIREAVKRRLPSWGVCLQVVGLCLVLPGAFGQVPPAPIVIGWVVAGCGTGIVLPALSVHALALTPEESKGSTSSALQIADSLGAAFCVAAGGIAYALALPGIERAFALMILFLTLLLACAAAMSRRIRTAARP